MGSEMCIRDRMKSDAVKEIATELTTDEGEVGCKLHNLRTQYSTERRKEATTKSGSGGDKRVRRWCENDIIMNILLQ